MNSKLFYLLIALTCIITSCKQDTAGKFEELVYSKLLTENIWVFDHAEGASSALGIIDPVELGFMDEQIIMDFNNTGKLNIHNTYKGGEINVDQYNRSYYFTGDTLTFSNAPYTCFIKFVSNEQMIVEFRSKESTDVKYYAYFTPFTKNRKQLPLNIDNSEWITMNLSADSGRIWFYEGEPGKRYAQLIDNDSTNSLLEGRYSVINYKGLQLIRMVPQDDTFKGYSLYCYEATPDKIRFECSSDNKAFTCDFKRFALSTKNLIKIDGKWSYLSDPDKILLVDSASNKYTKITPWDTIQGFWSMSPEYSFMRFDQTLYHVTRNKKELNLTSGNGKVTKLRRD